MSVKGALLCAILAVIMVVCLAPLGEAKKTSKEWAEFNKKKLHQLEMEEHEEMKKSLGNEVPIEKPGMVFATFGPDITKKDKTLLAQKFNTQLQSGGIKVSMFESSENQWVIATFRTMDTFDVVKYLRQQPEVMTTTVDSTDYWNLPRYQKEYAAAMEEKKKVEEKKGKKPTMKTNTLSAEELEARKRSLLDQVERDSAAEKAAAAKGAHQAEENAKNKAAEDKSRDLDRDL